MALKDVVKINRKTFFDPRAWLGYDFLKAQTIFLYRFIRQTFTADQPVIEETFEEAKKRLNLTEEDIQNRMSTFLALAIVFLILGIATLIFGLYLLFFHFSFAGLVLAIATAALLLTQAFRYHFWYFQMQQRRLGITYQEWKAALLKKKTP